ncbi:MAG: nucleotidyltransferase family protein [Eubacteriales bacterium]
MEAVLLLAGKSERFGENKLCYPIKGKAMYRYMWDVFCHASEEKLINHLYVVTQYQSIMEDLQEENCILIHNKNPEKGISHSIKLALGEIRKEHPDSENCLFSVGDQPFFQKETMVRFIENHRKIPQGISLCAHENQRGNPVIFFQKYYPELMGLQGDVGGKQVISRYPEDVFFFPVEKQELEDIDVKPL